MSFDLTKVEIKEKVAEFEHPLGFKVILAFLPTSIEKELGKKCITSKFERGRSVEDVDTDKYYQLVGPKIVRGWSGLTFRILKSLMPIGEVEGAKDDDEIEYSAKHAVFLLRNSEEFDNWVQQRRSDLSYFNEMQEAEKN